MSIKKQIGETKSIKGKSLPKIKSTKGQSPAKPSEPKKLLSASSVSTTTVSSETIKFQEIIPRLAEFNYPVPAVPRTRSKTIIIDWKYLNSCSGKTSILLMAESLMILIIIAILKNNCIDAESRVKNACHLHIVLAGLTLATFIFHLVLNLFYTFHLIEKFNQSCWLRVEFTCHLMYTVHFTILSGLILNEATSLAYGLGLIALAVSFNGFIISIDRLVKVCTGKPAQIHFDDADGNRSRIGIMRLRFGV